MTADDFKPTQRGFQRKKTRLERALFNLARLTPLDAGFADAFNEYRSALDAHTGIVTGGTVTSGD